jgi:hypothetical protein
MKGIYLTQEAKQEIEAKIAELNKIALNDERTEGFRLGRLKELNKILSSATILPVEESWYESVPDNTEEDWDSIEYVLKTNYPNGVIIQSK